MIAQGIHHGISFAQYLSGEGMPAPAVSGSDLVNFDTECAAYAYAFWRSNPNREQSEDTPATAFGSAAHCLILEGPDAFDARYVVKPEGMNFATKEGKAWRAEAEEGGHEIVSHEAWQRMNRMRAGLGAHPDAKRILFAGGKAETTMIARDPDTGLWLLARPDLFIERAGLLVNLKTARALAVDAFERQVWSLRYFLSDAFARHVAKLCGVATPKHAFLVVGNEAPHLGYVAALKADAAAWGDQQVKTLLRQFAACVESGHWPSYSDGVLEIGIPAWGAQQLTQKIQTGEAA